MKDSRKLWAHAARVATVAMLVVLACYAICAFGLRVFIDHRLMSQADQRVHAALFRAGLPLRPGSTSPSTAAPNGDLDDAPVFLWYVPAHGRIIALTVGAPILPSRSWSDRSLTRMIGQTPFRFAAVPRHHGWIVAGQNVSEVRRLESALDLPEVLFGLLLAAATFAGSLLVAYRASLPLELIRRRQAEFTADASHELRTPLSVVEAEVDLALRRRRTPEEYEAVLGRIAGEGRRLRRIVDDLLWLARADSGTDAQDGGEVVDVRAVVASCVDRFAAVATRDGVSLSFESAGRERGVVRASAELVDRLAGVLIDNACKYAGTGGTVSVVVLSHAGHVVLRVDDSGPGIPAEEREAVFDRFHRAAAGGTGSGLGLAIADSVVRLTSASWSVASAPLGGARMEVTWPMAPRGERPPGRDTGRDGAEPEGSETPLRRNRPENAHLGAP